MMQDPEVMAKLSKMMSGGMPNPAELASDPKLAKRTFIPGAVHCAKPCSVCEVCRWKDVSARDREVNDFFFCHWIEKAAGNIGEK